MSRLKMPPKKEALDKRVQEIADLAKRLHDLLNNRQSVSTELSRELDKYTKQLPLNSNLSAKQARTLDALGTDLWNASAGLINETQRDPRPRATDPAQQAALVRVFAFLLIDAADSNASRSSKRKDEESHMRTLTVAFRAARLCLDKNELPLALTVLETCKPRITDEQDDDTLPRMTSGRTEDQQTSESTKKDLAGEFYLLRLLHAWKSGRLDLADHYYGKVNLTGISPTSHLPVKAIDLFYEVARSFSKLGQPDEAIKWFDRSFRVSDQVEPEYLSQEAAELLLSIGVSFADTLLSSPMQAHRKRAWEIVRKLEQTHGLSNRLTIPVLRFRVLVNEHRVDQDQMAQTLQQIVRLAILTEENFKMIIKTLRRACEKSCITAMQALRIFICTRLLANVEHSQGDKDISQSWLEKAAVAYILFHTKRPDFTPKTSLDDLQDLFDIINGTLSSPFSAKATHAAQTLLWKSIGQSSSGDALGWCHLLRHPLFDNAGYINKARIGRKTMRIALDDGNANAARQAFFEMPEPVRNDSLSRLLAFKTALISRDEDLAMESLRTIVKTATRDPTILYACVLEAQRSNIDHMTLAALQALLSQKPLGTHMPALLRCTVRLSLSQTSDNEHSIDDIALEAVKVFETAARYIDELRQTIKAQWAAEVQWWSKNSYNFALRHCKDVHPQLLFRILEVCLKFLDCYPNDIQQQQQRDVEERKSLCLFLSTTALIVMGRANEDGPEHATQCFLHARDRIARFKPLQGKIQKNQQGQETTAREFTMLKFEVESIIHLREWDRLNDTLRQCLEVRSAEKWDALADLLIIMHEQLDGSSQESYSEMIVEVLERIINDTWKKQKEIVKVARWVRFTHTLCLSHVQSNFSFRLLEQAAAMAENGYRGKHEAYPENELQWLATTSFNRAIDVLVEAENEQEAMRWMDGALALAKWSQDSGSLHAVLTAKKEAAEQHVRDRAMQA